jgi:hypothetical protein
VTVKVCPVMVSVPVRELVLVFAATEKLTVPLPEPLLPEVMVIQLSLLVAVQAQLLGEVTFTLPLPPLLGKGWLVGEIASPEVIA